MSAGFSELYRAASKAMELCKVRSEEKAIVYADTRQPVHVLEAFHTALVDRGCDVTYLQTLRRFPETDPPPAAVQAMKEADFVVDMATESWVYAPKAREILDTGTRMLLILDLEEDEIVKRPPDEVAGNRALAAADLLREGEVFRITTPEGSDFTCRRSGRPYSVAKGYADEAGRFVLYSASMINFAPIETSGEGVLYLNGPQILYPQHTYAVEKPVRVEVKGGRITAVDDSHADGRIFRSWLQQFDENVKVVSHVGFGTDHRADLARFDISQWESYYGGVIVAFGANDSKSLQGTNRSAGHSDSIILNATLTVDGVPVIVDGEFTEESGLRQPI